MDPDACVQRINDAIADGDHEEEQYARQDLAEWLRKGGLPPSTSPNSCPVCTETEDDTTEEAL